MARSERVGYDAPDERGLDLDVRLSIGGSYGTTRTVPLSRPSVFMLAEMMQGEPQRAERRLS